MAFKPNYKHQRAERDRAKQAKKQEKLRLRQEQADLRKTDEETAAVAEGDTSA